MNYSLCYNRLIDRAKERKLVGYVERHHIMPRCLGGTDDALNIVVLTAREHYLAHLLLVKIHPGRSKLVYAAHMMTIGMNGRRSGNRKYEWLRRKHSEAARIAKMGNTYMVGRGRSPETKEKIRKATIGHKRGVGRVFDQECKSKLSAASVGKAKSAAHSESMSRYNRNKALALGNYSDGGQRTPGVIERKNGTFIARGRSQKGERVCLGFFKTSAEAIKAVNES